MTRQVVKLPRSGARRRIKKCPVCARATQPDHAPFCSRRCADEDLRRWLSGDYRVPTNEPADAENGGDR